MNRFFKVSTMAVLAVAFICAKSTSAQDKLKIAYVDFDEVFKRYYKTQLYQEKIQDEANQEEKNLQEKVDEINKLKQELELLSDEARKEKEKTLQSKIAEAQGSRDQTRRDFQRKTINTMNEIFDEIYKVIEKKGKEGGYSYILRLKMASPTIDQQIILYAEKKFDITEEIIAEINKGSKDVKKEESKGNKETKTEDKDIKDEIKDDMPANIKSE